MNWLPEGYKTRAVTREDEQEVVNLINTYYCWMNGGAITTLEEMQSDWQEEGFNRDTDAILVTNSLGKIVGYADLWNVNSLRVRLYALTAVDPQHMGCGIGASLAQWLIERARQNVHLAPEGARVVLQQGANINNQAAYDLLTRTGFQVARHSYRMRIDFDGPPEAPKPLDGITIRSIRSDEEERAAIQASYDAFQDHWGFVEEPFEEYYKRWKYALNNDPHYDPTLYFVAMDGDEVAGVSLCSPRIEEDPEMAWVGTLGVLRPWRRRGLGLALLQHSFQEFYKRGNRRAGLGVDAQSLTGALHLYEKAGMRIWRETVTYEYELRPGKDLMRQTLEE